MATTDEVYTLLEEYSTKKYFIEHTGSRSNHMAHGIIALYRLGATKERIREFAEYYALRLEPPRLSTSPSQPFDMFDEGERQQLLGRRMQYYDIKHYYSTILHDVYNDDLDKFLKNEFFKLANGMHCAALHPMIHLGYGFNVRRSTIVMEGMAYQHYAHVKTERIPQSNMERTLDILEVLRLIRESDIQENTLKYASDPGWRLGGSDFVRRMNILTTHPVIRGRIIQLLHQIRFPDWFNLSSATMQDILQLMETILLWAVTVYTGAENRNDFFLLHGVTGGWGLLEILKTFQDPVKGFDCIQYYVATLLSVYVTQGCPDIKASFLKISPNSTWDDLTAEVLKHNFDSHIYKLVHVCYTLGKENANDDVQKLLKSACRVAIDHDFNF